MEIHRWAAQPHAGVVGHRSAGRRASDACRCRCQRLRLAARSACRSARGRAASTSSRCGPTTRPPIVPLGLHRLRRSRGHAAGPGAARDRHEHLQRLQQLGWLQPLHRRAAGVVRPAVRARDARAAVDRARRSQVAARVSRRRARCRRADLPGVPLRQRLPGVHELGRLVHLRASLRRVGRVGRPRVRLRRVERPRCRPGGRATATTS